MADPISYSQSINPSIAGIAGAVEETCLQEDGRNNSLCTEEQQYEIEYRICNDISNAMYVAHAQIAEWTKKDGNQNDNRVCAAVRGLGAFTNEYMKAEKEPKKGIKMEKEQGTRLYNLLARTPNRSTHQTLAYRSKSQ